MCTPGQVSPGPPSVRVEEGRRYRLRHPARVAASRAAYRLTRGPADRAYRAANLERIRAKDRARKSKTVV
jgi:hypothetical protein